MKYGAAIFATDEGLHPAELGRLVEGRLRVPIRARAHPIPSSRSSAAPRGGELPREYQRTLDPFVTLTAVAGVTQKLRIGTGICLMVERDPITTAKEVASVDWVSGGRFLFGVGGGWNLEEMHNHGTDPARRFALLKDRVRAMKEIWTADEAAYHGEFIDFGEIWAWPKPVQKPHPPILMAATAPPLRSGSSPTVTSGSPKPRMISPTALPTSASNQRPSEAQPSRSPSTAPIPTKSTPTKRPVPTASASGCLLRGRRRFVRRLAWS